MCSASPAACSCRSRATRVAREILVQAGKHRARLICLGASDRTLPGRIVRGDLIERILRAAPADVAVYRGVG